MRVEARAREDERELLILGARLLCEEAIGNPESATPSPTSSRLLSVPNLLPPHNPEHQTALFRDPQLIKES